jgi:predicted transcriptional regulator
MNDFDIPPSGRSLEHEEQIRRLEQMLEEGLDDLKAGRVVSRDEMRREIDALFAERAAKHSLPKRA